MSYMINLTADIAYDRKNRTGRNTKQVKCWKKQSKKRAQWARHGAKGITAAEKLEAVLADEAAAMREWAEMKEWILFDAGVDMDEPAGDADGKPELDEQELAYWKTVFQCA